MDTTPTKKTAGSLRFSSPSAASPTKSPRTPCSPSKTAELWDGYEKMAIEKAKGREELTHQMDQRKGSSPSRPSFDFKARREHAATPSTTVSVCKTCQQPMTYASGICEHCIKTAAASPLDAGETTPPLSPAEGTMVLPEIASVSPLQIVPREEVITPSYTSPKRPSFCPLPSHLTDASTRNSFAQPTQLGRRKKSPSEPSHPSLHLEITPQPYVSRPQVGSPPMTPTSPLYTTHSICSTRRSSLANVTMVPKPAYLHHVRNDSGTPSEFSTLYQTVSTATTPPGSLHRFGYPLQNATSVWDDWDTEEEDEAEPEAEADRAGIASWMVRRKGRSGRDRSKTGADQPYESVGEDVGRGGDAAAAATAAAAGSVRGSGSAGSIDKVKKSRGLFRALSCGCVE